jgi:hypothetical protein
MPSPGAPMRNGPVLLDRYVPDEDATVLERVLDAGAIILGKAVGLREPVLLRGSHSHTAGWSTGARLPQVRRGMRWTMQPRIDRTQFGSVTIDGKVFTHDVLIRLGGQVEKRKKKLSKAVYGTSHTISLAEAKHLYQKGAARLLIGAGQHGTVGLSEEAASHFQRHRCQVELLPTPQVIPARPGGRRGRSGGSSLCWWWTAPSRGAGHDLAARLRGPRQRTNHRRQASGRRAA